MQVPDLPRQDDNSAEPIDVDSSEEVVEAKKPDLNLSLSCEAPGTSADLSNHSDASVSEPTAAEADTAHQDDAASERATKGVTVMLNPLLSGKKQASPPWHHMHHVSSSVQPLPNATPGLLQQAAATPLEPQQQNQAAPHTLPASIPVAFPSMDPRLLQTEVPVANRPKRRLSPPPGISSQQLHPSSTDRQAIHQPDTRQPNMRAGAAFHGANFKTSRAEAHALLATAVPVKQSGTDTHVDVMSLLSPTQQAHAMGIHADSDASAMEAIRSYHDAQDKSPDAGMSQLHAHESANSLQAAEVNCVRVPQVFVICD